MTRRLPVLMYHSVAERPSASTRRLSISPNAFTAQLELLCSEGFVTVTFSEIVDALAGMRALPSRAVTLTFDDGYADFHEVVLPRLHEFGCTATVFVTTGWLEDAGDRRAGPAPGKMLSWGQVQEIASAGIEIGAHSHSHPELDQLPDNKLLWELRTSKDLLEQYIGVPVDALAYPFGYWSRRVQGAVRSTGYRSAAAVANVSAQIPQDRLAVPRLTVRRSTTPNVFRRLMYDRRIAQTFLGDRSLTAGWAIVRHAKYVLRHARLSRSQI
jgi:peptidoglycan/xylan/chitin deacetylase (PgdA/CDA1 family)